MRVLIVEDSQRVSETVTAALRTHGHVVVSAGGVRAADEACAEHRFDVAIVDIGLPDGSGLEWCRASRRAGSDFPILLLTARDRVDDRIEGLDAGADDYLAKPFSVDELMARLRALGRRGPRWSDAVRRFGFVVIDADRRTVTVAGATLPLTAREFDIIALLSSREGRVVERGEVLEAVWGDAGDRASASLDVLVARIRRKLSEHGVDDAIRTLRQVGYSWAIERSKLA